MITGKISTLKNNKGGVAFPITTANAVYMDDGSTKLNDKIEDIETSLDNIMSGRKEFFVSDFGAIGDGVNDDTNSIIKAIEQCQMYKGSTLIFPYGFVCRTTETIQIPININVIMNGYSKILYDGNECALKLKSILFKSSKSSSKTDTFSSNKVHFQ